MSRPGWVKLDLSMMTVLDEVLSRLPQTIVPLEGDPEQSDALGINSNNLRLKTAKGTFVLKRWSDQATPRDIQNTLAIMAWLASRQLPVPAPVELQQDSFILSIGSGTWSLFPFVEGAYFSGADDELYAAAEATGRLLETLPLLPAACLPTEGPAQMTAADGELLRRVNDVSWTWDALLGTEHAELLALSWPLLMAEWENLSTAKVATGRTQAAHFDLHPHNLLVSGGKVAAMLDFEACKVMPVGFALGFAALKQCRQAMTLRPLAECDPRLVGSLYADQLLRTFPGARQLATHLGDLAVAEVLRRICIILRLNLENGEKKWNKVLGVQLGHLGEARALFG
jgi:aminoglycoside phosphotransferase (APT) family kinase protein